MSVLADPIPTLLIQEEFFATGQMTLMCPGCSHLRRVTQEWVRDYAGEVALCGGCGYRARIPDPDVGSDPTKEPA